MMPSRSSKSVVTLCSLLALGSMPPQGEFLARTGFFGPRAELRYAKPTLKWEIWSDNGFVTSSEMRVNGSIVNAHYDPDSHALVFTPASPMPPGSNKIHCTVTFNGNFTFTREWEVIISPSAIAELPPTDPQQEVALETANEIRRRLGLPKFIGDSRLNAAAKAHSEYMTRNHLRGHGERNSDDGFIGADPSVRLEAFGWSGPSWEGLAYQISDPRSAVMSLYDAPYHRLPFMQPGAEQFGFGMSGKNATAEFEGCHQRALSVSPSDGETEVPTSWVSREIPNPLAVHPEAVPGVPIGYPIMLAEFGERGGRIAVLGASLTDAAGTPVATYLNTPFNDPELSNAVILIPESPLRPATKYRATVSLTANSGKPMQKSWSFRTAARN